MKRLTLLIIIAVGLARAEFVIEVMDVTGNVQIKREESRRFEPLEKGAVIEDNDILQTSYKSKCEVRLNRDNLLFMGSNSRILMSKVVNEDKKTNISITLFSGSIYSKIIKQVNYSIYTSTALCRVENGIFNCTVDEESGITGFHVFKGEITVSNISVQGEQSLKGGETSTLAPGTPPSAARKISAKQMSVLIRFYGADFINQEIEATGVEVVSGTGGSAPAEKNVVSASDDRQTGSVTAAENTAVKEKATRSFKLFNKADALRRLYEFDQEHYWMYSEPGNSTALGDYRYRAGALFSQLSYDGKTYLDYTLRPGLFFKNMSLVFNLSMVSDSFGKPGFSLAGSRGILDKLYALDAEYRGNTLHAGAIEGLTFGRGVILRDYTSRAFSDNVRNTGLLVRYKGYLSYTDFFVSSLADFHLVGVQYRNADTLGSFGVALVRENGEKPGLNNGDYAFRGGAVAPAGVSPDSLPESGSLTAAEIQISRNLFYINPVKISFYFTMAGFIQDGLNLKGFDLTIPGLEVIWGKQVFLSELYLTRNHFTRGLFGPLYEDNLYRVRRDSTGAVQSGVALASLLPSGNTSVGFKLGYKVNPLKRVTFSAVAEGLVFHFSQDSTDTTGGEPKQVSSTRGRNDGSLDLRLQIGGDRAARLSRLEAYYTIRHIGYFTNGVYAPFSPNPFTTTGVKAHLMIMRNLEAAAGYEIYYTDQNGDNKAAAGEKVMGISLGLALGF